MPSRPHRPYSARSGGRRSSAYYGVTGGPFSPINVAGLAEWLNGDDIIGKADGDEITTWPHRVGVDATCSATSGVDTPNYVVATGVGGKASVRCGITAHGNNQKISFTAPAALSSQPLVVFLAMRTASTATARNIWVVSQAANGPQVLVTTGPVIAFFAGTLVSSTTAPTTTDHVVCAVYNGASSKLYLDGGAAIASGNAGTGTFGAAETDLGANGTTGNTDTFYRHALFYQGSLTNAQLDQVGTYLASDIGTTWTAVS